MSDYLSHHGIKGQKWGVYNEAHDPIIIFRAKECIEPYKKAKVGKVVTDDEINNRSDRVRTEMKKKGKNLLL